MPSASRMPRTRRVQRWQAVTRVATLVLLTFGGAIARASAGEQWWWSLLAFLAFAAGLVAVTSLVSKRLTVRYQDAYREDLSQLTQEERALPYGVVQDGDDILLPTKAGTFWLTVVVAALLVVGGGATLAVDDTTARVFGGFMIGIGLWCALLAWWIRGARIRLTPTGIESTMGPRKFHTWLEIPEITIDRVNVIVKAATSPRPRIWIRCGVLQVSVGDAVAMIRKQRAW